MAVAIPSSSSFLFLLLTMLFLWTVLVQAQEEEETQVVASHSSICRASPITVDVCNGPGKETILQTVVTMGTRITSDTNETVLCDYSIETHWDGRGGKSNVWYNGNQLQSNVHCKDYFDMIGGQPISSSNDVQMNCSKITTRTIYETPGTYNIRSQVQVYIQEEDNENRRPLQRPPRTLPRITTIKITDTECRQDLSSSSSSLSLSIRNRIYSMITTFLTILFIIREFAMVL